MKKFLLTLCLVVTAFGAMVHDAEAKRLGGGKSVGMQRESVSRPASAPSSAPAPSRNASAPATAPAPAPAAPAGNRWLGPLAGLAAGIGLGALFAGGGLGGMGGLGSMLSTILMIAALAFVVSFALRMFRRQSETASPVQYAGAGGPAPVFEPAAPPAYGTAPVATAGHIPADFDVEGFIRVAKLNFLRLQAANDEGNIDDLREFLSPELLAEVKLQIEERGKVVQKTDVQQLTADLLEVVSDAHRHVASVRFHGLIKEEEAAPAAPFDEVWHLAKPIDGSRGWTIAGIQQIS